LNIIEAVADTYRRAEYSGFSRQARIKRLTALIDNTQENTIGVYPAGITSLAVLRFYRENIGELKCRVVQFDSNPAVWGKSDNGTIIYSPDDITKVSPSIVLITSYIYKDEIYEAIKDYEDGDIRIVKLQRDNELPWLL
jgi:hypothetical protein